jgi:hypothetical protein
LTQERFDARPDFDKERTGAISFRGICVSPGAEREKTGRVGDVIYDLRREAAGQLANARRELAQQKPEGVNVLRPALERCE